MACGLGRLGGVAACGSLEMTRDFDLAEYQRRTGKGVSVQAGKPERRKSPGRAAVDADVAKGANKFHNQPVMVDGERIDSKREAKRLKELRMLLRAGRLLWLARQVEFILQGGIIYKADFVYLEVDGPAPVIEDAKGMRTPEYKLKKKLMAAAGFDIVEV